MTVAQLIHAQFMAQAHPTQASEHHVSLPLNRLLYVPSFYNQKYVS